MQVSQKLQRSRPAYRLSYCLSIITHSIRSLNTNTSINAPMEQQLKNVDLEREHPFYLTYFDTLGYEVSLSESARCTRTVKPSVGNVDLKGIHSSICSLCHIEAVCDLFSKCTAFEGRHADPLSADVELNRNVRSVCLASRSTVRVSGGLKSS